MQVNRNIYIMQYYRNCMCFGLDMPLNNYKSLIINSLVIKIDVVWNW